MEQILKDWSAYIVGIPTIILTIWLGLYLYNKQKNNKKLSFLNLLNNNIVNVKIDLKENLSVTYNGEKAENLRLIILKIINDGEVPILKNDFENDIKISFDTEAKLLDAEIIEKSPVNIDLNLKQLNNYIVIKPCLINPKDSFTIKILINSTSEFFSIDSRIANIDKIKEVKITDPKRVSNIFQYTLSGMLIIISIQFVYMNLYNRLSADGNVDMMTKIIIGLGSFLLIGAPYLFYYITKELKNYR